MHAANVQRTIVRTYYFLFEMYLKSNTIIRLNYKSKLSEFGPLD